MKGGRTVFRSELGRWVLAAVCWAWASHACAHPSGDARLEAIDRELREQPRSAALLIDRADANRQAGRWEDALADLAQARELEPRSDRVLLVEACVMYDRGTAAEALPPVESYLAAHPESAEARQLHARALGAVGRLRDAVLEYDLLIGQLATPRPEPYVERARILAREQRLDDALRGLDEGTERLGSIATLQLTAVEMEVDRRAYDSAVRRLDGLLLRSPRQAFWLTRRAELLALAGRRDEARAAFRQAQTATSQSRQWPAALLELQKRIRDGLAALDRSAYQPVSACQSSDPGGMGGCE